MQKLNLKNVLVSILLVAVFFGGNVLAAIPGAAGIQQKATAAATSAATSAVTNAASGAINAAKAAALAKAQAAVTEKLAVVNDLKSKFDAVKAKATEAQNLFKVAESEFKTAQIDYQAAALEAQKAKADLAKLQTASVKIDPQFLQAAALKSDVVAAQKKVAAADKKLADAKKDLITANDNLKKAEGDKKAAKAEQKAAQDKVDAAEAELKTAQADLKKAESAFEVTLQTPFAKPPPAEECEEDKSPAAKPDYKTTQDGYTWVCYPESKEWQQIIRGKDGGEILENYAAMLYKWLAGFIGIVAVLMLVVGGIQISTAGASQEGLQGGKDRIIAALVGLMLLFLASLILYTINPGFFGQDVEVDYVSVAPSAVVPAVAPTVPPVAVSGEEYSHDDAVAELKAAGITIWSSGGDSKICADPTTCLTSFQSIKQTTVDGVIALKNLCSVSTLQVNGGTENGKNLVPPKKLHSDGSTHYSGLAIDIQANTNFWDCLKTNGTPSSTDATKYKLETAGNKFWIYDEKGHLHVEVNSPNASA